MEFLVFIVIVGIIIYAIYKYNQKADEENRIQEEQERIRAQKRYEEQQKRITEEIINSDSFKKDVKFLYDISRCFNLAGGEPIIGSTLKYGDEKGILSGISTEIIIEKQGYDLPTDNLKEYYNSPAPECYDALNRFAVDLFGKYADEMKNFISIEWIADHMIELNDINNYKSDFILRYTFNVSCKPEWKNYGGDIRALCIQEYKKL